MENNNLKNYILKVLTGPHQGSSYKIISQTITIGRSAGCDIVFAKDIKVSRKHVKISFEKDQILIENLSQKNTIFVDGKACKGQAFLNDSSSFQLGDTSCQISSLDHFLVQMNQKKSNLLDPSKGQNKLQEKTNENDHLFSFLNKNKQKKSIKIYLIAFILLGCIFFVMQEEEKTDKQFKVLTESQINSQIEANRQMASNLDQEMNHKKKNTLQYKEAYVHYIKGLRDYNKGVYRRAMISFQACLSLFSNHVMCRRYHNLTKKKLFELIQYYMVQGKKYMKRYQFPACKTAYRNVMSMIQDRKNKTYREARGYFLICKKRWNNRF